MAARPWLLDLGNRRLKVAQAGVGGALAGLAERTLPRAEEHDAPDWDALALWLAERVGEAAGEVRVASTHPRAWDMLRARPPLRDAPITVAGESGWPIPVRSRGTGADRVLAAYAAWLRCGRALLVADLGTAWTLDAVDGEGAFLGGLIGPGLGVQEQALAGACPHLAPPQPGAWAAIPDRTAAAVACGTRGALAAALEVMATRFEESMGGPARRFLTGGDGQRLRPLLTPEWEVVDHLVLEGLARLDPPSAA